MTAACSYHEITNYYVSLGHYFCWQVKCQSPKLIHYFPSHPVAFGLQASTSPDKITLNTANKKTDQSPSNFQTGIGAAAHATLSTEQLFSHTRATLVDAVASLQGYDRGFITTSKVHELLRFITFWKLLCLNRMVIQLIF